MGECISAGSLFDEIMLAIYNMHGIRGFAMYNEENDLRNPYAARFTAALCSIWNAIVELSKRVALSRYDLPVFPFHFGHISIYSRSPGLFNSKSPTDYQRLWKPTTAPFSGRAAN